MKPFKKPTVPPPNTTRKNSAIISSGQETLAERNAILNAKIEALLAERKAKNQNAAAVNSIVAGAMKGRQSAVNKILNAQSNDDAQSVSATNRLGSLSMNVTRRNGASGSVPLGALNALNSARRKSARVLPAAEAPAPSPSKSTAASVGNLFAPGFGNATTPAPQNPKVSDKRSSWFSWGRGKSAAAPTSSYSDEQAKRNAADAAATRDRDNAVQIDEFNRLVALKKKNNWNDKQLRITKFKGPDGRVVLQKLGSMATNQLGGARQTRRRRNPKKRRATRKG
jgi:hypothetical protein